uniref:Linoleate diol synthase n=1 Tax=Ganoderma boninense TaxID=34458 RepID=A0A5K1JX20_9APHY|nr:Linoleate diol synthase [Ganoderma boninense]
MTSSDGFFSGALQVHPPGLISCMPPTVLILTVILQSPQNIQGHLGNTCSSATLTPLRQHVEVWIRNDPVIAGGGVPAPSDVQSICFANVIPLLVRLPVLTDISISFITISLPP